MDRGSLTRFNIRLALALLLFFVVLGLLWVFVVMPICDARDWKLPCPPRWMGEGIGVEQQSRP
ncbi:MAG TPA: hypothetical protein VI231_15545 [Candidatus Binatia bacterium]